jgi:hypothetical protein
MVDEIKNTSGLEEDLLLTFLARTRDGAYAVLDECPLSNLRIAAYSVITDDVEYYCSLS